MSPALLALLALLVPIGCASSYQSSSVVDLELFAPLTSPLPRLNPMHGSGPITD